MKPAESGEARRRTLRSAQRIVWFSIMETSINRVLRDFRKLLPKSRPTLWGGTPVLGSFPAYAELHVIGSRANYFIHDGYKHGVEPQYYKDATNSDEWQDEVYRFAKEIADRHELRSVLDIGCGSGFKLMKYFRDRTTTGVDVPETCANLRQRYPDRRWTPCDFHASDIPKADLVIASDVIEHLVDPDELLRYIVRIDPRYVVISTPDRNLLRYKVHNGPPSNRAHIREWSMAELHAYISHFLDIVDHFISAAPQATQCVLARPRATHDNCNLPS